MLRPRTVVAGIKGLHSSFGGASIMTCGHLLIPGCRFVFVCLPAWKPRLNWKLQVYNARETFKLMHKQSVQFRTKSAVHAGATSDVFRDALRGLGLQSPMLRHLNLS